MKRVLVLVVMFLLATSTACGAAPSLPTAAPTPNVRATETNIAVNIFGTLTASAPVASNTASATSTSAATATPPPTNTAPPDTDTPTATAPPPTATAIQTRPPQLTQAPPTTPAPLVSQDALRGQIVFKSARNGGSFQNNSFAYYAMNADGSNQRLLPFEAANQLYRSRIPFEGYSPDRSKVVVGEFQCFNGPCFLYILDPQLNPALERSQGQWTPSGAGYRKAVDPVWSPDGGWIAFVANWDNNRTSNIFKGTPFSGQPNFRRLTDFGGQANTSHPSYSPDGSALTFSTTIPTAQNPGLWQIWVLDPNGGDAGAQDFRQSNPHNLSNSHSNDWDPLWIK